MSKKTVHYIYGATEGRVGYVENPSSKKAGQYNDWSDAEINLEILTEEAVVIDGGKVRVLTSAQIMEVCRSQSITANPTEYKRWNDKTIAAILKEEQFNDEQIEKFLKELQRLGLSFKQEKTK